MLIGNIWELTRIVFYSIGGYRYSAQRVNIFANGNLSVTIY